MLRRSFISTLAAGFGLFGLESKLILPQKKFEWPEFLHGYYLCRGPVYNDKYSLFYAIGEKYSQLTAPFGSIAESNPYFYLYEQDGYGWVQNRVYEDHSGWFPATQGINLDHLKLKDIIPNCTMIDRQGNFYDMR